MSARENILQKIKQALENPVPVPYDISDDTSNLYPRNLEDDAVLFAQEFTSFRASLPIAAMKMIYASNSSPFLQSKALQKFIAAMKS